MREEIRYTVDANDIIIAVDGDWEHAALEGEAPELVDWGVVGDSIWEHVRDGALRTIYANLYQRVRADGEVLTFPYRCDSAAARRFMEMLLKPGPERGDVAVLSRLVAEEKRAVSLPWLNSTNPSRAIARCSMCNHLRLDGRWVDVTDAVAVELLLDTDGQLMVVHNICSTCQEGFESGQSLQRK